MNIEDIILAKDQRGISALRPHLPYDFCGRAASLVMCNPGTALIVTGFYILSAEAVETDGPPGAIAVGRALQTLGYEVIYVTDLYAKFILQEALGEDARVISFPITDWGTSRQFAEDLLTELEPSIIIGVERCGFTEGGLFLNMRGHDITSYSAKTDYLFSLHANSVGIGDGGNEIGMGNLAQQVSNVPTLVRHPCVTKVSELVISSVSNWGAYGLVTALSKLAGDNLLPSLESEARLVRLIVDLGAVDGTTGVRDYKIDGFSLEENSYTLARLHNFLNCGEPS